MQLEHDAGIGVVADRPRHPLRERPVGNLRGPTGERDLLVVEAVLGERPWPAVEGEPRVAPDRLQVRLQVAPEVLPAVLPMLSLQPCSLENTRSRSSSTSRTTSGWPTIKTGRPNTRIWKLAP